MSGMRLRIGPVLVLMFSSTVLNGVLAHAATDTWNGGGGDAPNNVWSNATNWSAGVPANDGSVDIHFAGNQPPSLTSDVDSTYSIDSLTFDSGASAFTLTNSGLTIGANGVLNASTNTQTINNPVTLGGSQTWNAQSGNLVFGSTVNLNGHILTIDGANNTTITGSISDSTSGNGLTKNGTGTLSLNAANTFTGPVILNAGTIQSGATNAFPGVTYTINGGTLNFNGNNSNLGAVTNSGGAVTLVGASSTIASYTQSGTGSLTTGTGGVATVTGALTLNGGTFDVTGGTGSAGSLAGNSSGNINLGSNGIFTDNTSGTDNYGGAITSSGGTTATATFEMNGTGILTLSNANNGTTFGGGNIVVQQGTLQSGVDGSLPTANYTVNGTLDVNNNSVDATALTGSGHVTLGSGTLTIADGGTSNYTGDVTGTTGSSINMETGTQTIGGAVTNVGAINGNGGTLTLNGAVTGATAVTATGGTIVLGGTNNYTGGTTLNAGGTVSISSDANIGPATSALTFNGGTLEVTGTALTSLATTHTINTATFNGGFDIDDGANTFTVSQALSGSGALAKSGDGTLLLTGTNTYSGGTTVTDGTLQGSTTSIQGNITATSPGTVDFTQSANGTYSGAISGTGSVVIDGNSSTVTFTGGNAYSGTTTIDSGTLQIGNGSTTGSLGTGAVTNDGALVFDRTDSISVGNIIGGSGTLTQNGTGTLTLTGTSNYTGLTTVSHGQLNVDGSITNDVTVASGATLGGVGTIGGDVNNSGTLTPGNSSTPATLSVGGNYTFAASGTTMNVTVNDSAAQNVSQLAVTGNAVLNNSKLNITLTPGEFDNTGATTYTVLTAANVNQDFASATTNLLFVKANLNQTSTDISFTLTQDFAGPGVTFNQKQVGNYLTANMSNTNTDFQALLTALGGITTAAQAQAALTALSGDIHPTMAQLNVNNTNIVIGQVAARLRGAAFTPGGSLGVAQNGSSQSSTTPIALVSEGPDGEPEIQSTPSDCAPQWTAWGIGYGMGASAAFDGNATGGNFGTGGVAAGLERWVDSCHLVGLYGAYVGSSIDLDNDQQASMNGGQVGGYMFADDGFNYYTLLGGFEFDGDNTTRHVAVGSTISDSNTSDYSDWQSFVYAERGMSFQQDNYVIQPFVAVQYIFVRQNGFTESGATNTAVDLAGSSDTTNSLRSMVGARFQYAMINHNGRRTFPELHAMWMHEYLDSDTSLSATMVPVGGTPFIVRGLDMGRDYGVVGASFTWEMADGWSMFVNYDLQTNTQVTYNTGSGGLGYRW